MNNLLQIVQMWKSCATTRKTNAFNLMEDIVIFLFSRILCL